VSFENADSHKVFQAWKQQQSYVSLADGTWAKIPKDWLNQYGARILEFLETREATQAIAPHKIPELTRLLDDVGCDYQQSLKTLRDGLKNYREIQEFSLPSDLKANLRDYQRKGFHWLSFLKANGLGALLADDMGLGKTLQTLCVLEKRSLVVAPTSVLFNWEQEIRKFRPALKTSLYYGPKRQLDPQANVVLTSYGLLRLDQELLGKEQWDVIVLDEAQVIKNPDSQIAKAAHKISGKFRVALSGTPVENHLEDLWSQFHFINPGLLGSLDSFSESFVGPMGRGDTQVTQKLKSRIKPFILRRLKKEVAPELPPRIEQILHCELDVEERKTYEMLMGATRQEVLKNLEQGDGGSVMKALEAILRLRQACCHRALIPGESAVESSSKTDLLMETLEESIEEGHKSLVFSQWTSYLDLIEAQLNKRGIRMSRIDGSTQRRGDLVAEFQSAEGPPVMLISLKAGGVGLNLTAADHVFITDPWWNPAAEDQAADRAHRIGQTNTVMIHRLVAKDSIEEKIIELQNHKKDLAKSVLEDGSAALSLTRQDILNLLS
jgi:SNF2 family DNA or RNA helicase